MKRWFAVHTHPHNERRAESNLVRQDFEVWLPLYRKKRRHAGRTETVLRPLFSRYLFVAIDLEAQRWRAILSTYGVAGLVGSSEGPQPLADTVIEALRARADDDGQFSLSRAAPIKPGSPVRVLAGPLSDIEGVLTTASDADRVVVLLEMLGRGVQVTLPASDIEAL